jgi:alpha-L-fucosidase 2
MYSGKKIPFQIDANFGFAGAVLSMLVVDLPLASDRKGLRTVVLGPAIPKAWGNGSVRGLRLRGGAKVDFKWDSEGIVQWARLFNSSGVDLVNKEGKQLVQCE